MPEDLVSGNDLPAGVLSGLEAVSGLPEETENVPQVFSGTRDVVISLWEESAGYVPGDLVSYGGKVYECIYAHTSNGSWLPDGTPTLWKERADLVAGVPTVSGSDLPDPGIPGLDPDPGTADLEALVSVCMEINQNVVTGTVALFIVLGFLAGIILIRGIGGFFKGV